ncbi:MAG TPA: hypothetical protein VGH27_23695 [Streptosporangiaceae bacterium]
MNVVKMLRSAESLESELKKEGVSEPATSATRTHDLPAPSIDVGHAFRHLGIEITLIDVGCSYSVYLNNSSYRSGSGRETYDEVGAENGAKFVTVKTRVLNDAKKSIDLTCSRPIANYLIDDRGRRFDSIGKLYRIRGNPPCNDRLQPGFTSDMTWIYRVPLDASILAFEFEDATDFDRDRTLKPAQIPLIVAPPEEI